MNSYIAQKLSFFLLAAALLAAFVLPAEAAFGPTINYQGKLTAPSGIAVADGTYNMRFWLLTSPSVATTSAIWTESLTGSNKVQVSNGLFSVMLGSTTPVTSVDFNRPLYLGVEIGGTSTPAWDGEMSPRKILGAAPAAFEADNAASLGGVASTSFLRSDQADTASGLLTFQGGLVAQSSSTITNLTMLTATTTYLVVNGERFSDLTGTALTSSAGVLSVDTAALASYFATTTDFDTCSELAAILSGNTTGSCGSFVLSGSPTFTGTVQAAALTLSSTLTLSGSAANIALGSNYLSGDGGDEGVFVSSAGLVGIGTTSPAARLQVAADGAVGTAQLIVSGSTVGAKQLLLGFDTTSDFGWIQPVTQGVAYRNLVLNPDGGNVGIGTTAPSAKLDTFGTSRVASTTFTSPATGAGIEMSFRPTGIGHIATYDRDTAAYKPLYFEASAISFLSNGTQGLYQNSSGNVGIGTTSPGAWTKLNVAGSGLFTDGSFDPGDGTPAGVRIGYNTGSAYGFVQSMQTGVAYKPLALQPGGGNVGIGTTSPGAPLDVQSAAASAKLAQFLAPNQTNGNLAQIVVGKDATTNYYQGALTYTYNSSTPSSSYVSLGNTTINSAMLNVLGNGNVGIGTTTPDNKLTVLGNVRSSTGFYVGDYTGNASGGFVNESDTSKSLTISADPGNAGASSFMRFNVDGSEKVRIDSAGNVGIGTTTTAGNKLAIFNSGADASILLSTVSGANEKWTIGIDDSDGAKFKISSSSALGTNDRLVINGNGNIGIGTASPGAKLAVAGDGTLASVAPQFTIQGSDSNKTLMVGYDTTNDYAWIQPAHWTVGYKNLILNPSGGNVGIGTASPDQKLTLRTGIFRLDNADFAAGSVGTFIDTSLGAASGNTYASIQNWNSGGSTGGVLALNPSGGNVGIGTTTPALKLTVSGTVGFTGLGAGAGAGSLCLDSGKQVVYSAGASCTVSSKQFKHDIESLTETSGLEAVAGLRPVSFVYNNDIGVPGAQIGFIAEEVLNIDPRLVVLDADGRPRGVKYENLTALLAKSIQELDARTSVLDAATAPIEGTEETLWDRLMTFADSFVDGVLTATGVRVEYVRSDYIESLKTQTETLCVGEICVTEEEFRSVFGSVGHSVSAGSGEGSPSEDMPADPNTEQDAEIADDAEVADVGADDEAADGADDEAADGTDFDLGDSASSTIDDMTTDTPESIAIIPLMAIPQAATSSALGQ